MAEAKITIVGEDLTSEVAARVSTSLTGIGDAAVAAGVASTDAGQTMFAAFNQPAGAAESFVGTVQDGVGAALHNVIGEASSAEEALKGLFEHPQASLQQFGAAIKEQLLATLGPGLAAAVAIGAAAVAGIGTGLMELGQHATEVGASIEKIALVANVSASGISDLKFAFEATGGSLDQVGTAMFMFEKRMDSSSDAVDKGLKMIGLSMGDIEQMSTDQKMLAISDAFRATGDDVNRAAAAFQIFGKQGRDLLPQLMQDLSGLTAKSKELGNTWSEEDVKAAHEFEIAAKTMATETASAWTQLGRNLAPVTNDIALAWDRMKLAVANVAGMAVDRVGDVATFGDELMALSNNAGDSTAALERLGGELPKVASSLKGAADGSGLAAAGLAKYNDQLKIYAGYEPDAEKRHAAALVAAAEMEQEAIRDLDSETQKHIETATKQQAAIDAVKAALEGDTKNIQNEIAALDQLIASGITDEDVKTRAIELITKLEDKHITLTDRIYAWDTAQRQLLDSVNLSSTALERYDAIAQLVDQTGESFTNLSATMTNEMYGLGEALPTAHFSELHETLTGVDDVTGNLASTELPAATGALTDFSASIEATDAKGKELLATLRNAGDDAGMFASVMDGIPKILEHAMTGGGGVSGAVKAIGSSVGKSIGTEVQSSVVDSMTNFGETALGPVMKGLTSMIPVIGAAIGPLLGPIMNGLKSLFGGVSQAEQDGRKLESSFEQSFGGFEGMMGAVGKGYAAAGLGAAQAQADVAALMAAEKQGAAATQAAIDTINAHLKAGTAAVAGGVQDILDAAKVVGANFPAAMQPVIAQLASLPGLTDAEKNSLLGLANAGQPSFNDLSQAAGRYGLTLDTIGGKAAQLSISTEADQIESDYKTLVTTSGADSDKVLAGMKDSLTKLVNHAMDAGDVLPTALKPLVDQLFNTGQLTDDAGNKITDLSKLKFDDTGDPLATGMKSLTDAINHLGDLLSPTGLPKIAADAAAGIGAALGGIKAPEIDLHYRYVADNSMDNGGAPSFANEGFDLTTPMRAIVGDNPLQSESVLHASTVKDIVRASRSAGAASAPSASDSQFAALHGTMQQIAALLKTQGLMLPRQIKAALA